VLAGLFALWLVGSLAAIVLLVAGVIPGSPLALAAVFTPEVLFALGFFAAYLRYHALHRLVTDGLGELFDVAITETIARTRGRGFKNHYRLRRCQGLALAGLPQAALAASQELLRDAGIGERTRLSLSAVMAEANLELGQPHWAQLALEGPANQRQVSRHPDLAACRGRLATLGGEADRAVAVLAPLAGVQAFPMTRVVRARNAYWYGEALAAAGDAGAALKAFARARKLAPRSHYGRLAARAKVGG
jgi:hypothetical protein